MQLKDTHWFILSILCLHFPSSSIQSSPESLYYVGAVVEYHPVVGLTEPIALLNVNNYINILKKAKELNSDLDIIVYPEAGIFSKSYEDSNLTLEQSRLTYGRLGSIYPNPSDKVTPCETKNSSFSEVLKKLSCAAKQYNTYLVINYVEKEDCKDCSEDHMNLYNSNIVFDRNGTVISCYRKYNLFFEYDFNVTSEPDLSTFETDFGVKFGQFICFDILFKNPSLSLLKKHQVTDIVFPNYWYRELPFMDSLLVQAAWSHTTDVNLLASGFNNPETGSTGSGIFAGKFQKIPGAFRSDKYTNALLIANVPKLINEVRNDIKMEQILYEFSIDEMRTFKEKQMQGYFLTDVALSSFTTTLVEPKVDQLVTLCKEDFCCHFNHKTIIHDTITKPEKDYYRYRFAVFSGPRSFGPVNLKVQVCGLMICANDSLSTCGKHLNTRNDIKFRTTFEKLQITTLVLKRDNDSALLLPISSQPDSTPLHPIDFSFKSFAVEAFEVLSLSLKTVAKNLACFGLYRIDFTFNDTKINTPDSSFFLTKNLFSFPNLD